MSLADASTTAMGVEFPVFMCLRLFFCSLDPLSSAWLHVNNPWLTFPFSNFLKTMALLLLTLYVVFEKSDAGVNTLELVRYLVSFAWRPRGLFPSSLVLLGSVSEWGVLGRFCHLPSVAPFGIHTPSILFYFCEVFLDYIINISFFFK